MNLKRTMNQALQAGKLTGEAVAFIAAGSGGAAVPPPPAPGNGLHPPVTPLAPATEASQSETAFVHSPLAAERRAPVSVTFRLPPELTAALLRFAMERKLRGEKPFTQQDILAEALRDWLERNVMRGDLPLGGDRSDRGSGGGLF